ncbi:MAG: CaiB/BaiF CoA transferase family protein, partial [Flavobacteriaceae bacterium]
PGKGPLEGVVVLDLTRILAGPTCTQLLGDYGATVIKIERPGSGDDTRSWGPPYLPAADGGESDQATYFMAANRNKHSVAIDIAQEEGAALVRRIALKADVVVENFKVGGLAKYGLDYPSLSAEHEGLIYCSITGFGQTGPYAKRAGYDFLAQGMGGIMSLTGEPDGEPVKAAVAVADLIAGMYSVTGILAALHHRERTGEGQHIDVALLDSQISWLVGEGTGYLNTGVVPQRRGNAHASIVPYQVFEASDGHMILACGNDGQFRRLCAVLGRPELADDPDYATNPARIRHREALVSILAVLIGAHTRDELLALLEAQGVPAGPVNTLDQTFADPQVIHRDMRIEMPHPAAGSGRVALIGNPVKMSATPPSFRKAPPLLGADTDAILQQWCSADARERDRLRKNRIIG